MRQLPALGSLNGVKNAFAYQSVLIGVSLAFFASLHSFAIIAFQVAIIAAQIALVPARVALIAAEVALVAAVVVVLLLSKSPSKGILLS